MIIIIIRIGTSLCFFYILFRFFPYDFKIHHYYKKIIFEFPFSSEIILLYNISSECVLHNTRYNRDALVRSFVDLNKN